CSKAVREVFVSLYEKGLIYKGSRIINWCPHCVTALSDAEVEYVDKPGHLWHIRYPLEDGSGAVIVATTRPETMLGDSGVCVNPNDERYKDIVGKNVILPLLNKPIPVVADDYAEMEFGTGCVKMTPAHDPNDFEVGLRHNLEVIRVLDDEGKVNHLGGKYEGMDRYEARKAIVADLEAQGYLVKVEDYSHNVGTCYRCHNDVEPIISAQWFVKMKPLAEEAIRVVKDGETKFVPERFTKTYLNWMENVRDWCISRQLWWGHQIPAWTCRDCGHMTVSREDACKCEKCGSTHIERDPDVLDTWFSSALWPFETLGWPEKNADLDYFYPTDVLVTGYDIIFFWVARMIFSGCEHTGKTPFHTVLIHGLVRDDKGRKMSKSLGNGIDPLEMIDKYGCDALRMNMITSNSPGNDMRFYVERCEAMRNFANKLWNATRYVLMNLGEDFKPQLPTELEIADKWVLSKLNTLIAEVTDNMERYELGIAVQKIYDFIWDTYCDWYIELTKARLYSEDTSRKNTALQVLVYVLDQVLRLLHPFMPFITEEIWQSLPQRESALIIAKWPEATEALSFKTEEAHMESVMNAIRAIRNRRAEMNVPPSKKATLYVLTSNPQIFTEGEGFIQRLAYADKVELLEKEPENLDGLVTCATADAKLYIPMGQLVDIAKELERIGKELEKARKNLESLEKKLSNENFVSRAPEAVVNAEREKAKKAADLISSLEESEAALEKNL
ncbi:MAG: valine--tRNA ligase, partial [Candidatus Faecousia sp.]|nr:valine--tRNA ligase [Candidatus Faecousia sp.]